jgi:hypothetical protein
MFFVNSSLVSCLINKFTQSVIPAPIFIRVNSSRNPDAVPRIKYGAKAGN